MVEVRMVEVRMVEVRMVGVRMVLLVIVSLLGMVVVRLMVMLSGMSSMSWVRTLHENIKQDTEKLVLMQCTSAYPTR